MDYERSLASIKAITDIQPIPDADRIICVYIGGWPVVTQVSNNFKIGDLVLYFEIDSWIPTKIAPFLTKEGHFPKIYNEIEGERLRTIKLKGQVSQGLILPLDDQFWNLIKENNSDLNISSIKEDDDLTELLNIQKWEKPLPAQLMGRARGNFPFFIKKTDQPRVQNLYRYIEIERRKNTIYEVSMKLDGSSMTCYKYKDELGVCSRNLSLKIDEDNKTNAFVKMYNDSKIEQALLKLNRNIAVQGELYGEGIQNNKEKIKGIKFAVFDIFDIDNQKYFSVKERLEIYNQLVEYGFTGDHVPIISNDWIIGEKTISDIVLEADGHSINSSLREGLVFKSIDGKSSFKAISNKWLLKYGD